MSFPIARAAVRYILTETRDAENSTIQDIIFITGVGKAHLMRSDDGGTSPSPQTKTSSLVDKDPRTSLRDYVQEILRNDFEPPIESHVPQWTPGTVEIRKSALETWMKNQAGE